MAIVDLSHPLIDGQNAFPTDPTFHIHPHCTIAEAGCNVSAVEFGTHHGTHVDAMYHIFPNGRRIAELPLDWFYGPARLLRIPKGHGGLITIADLEPFEASLAPEGKVILNTGWYRHYGAPEYYLDFPSLSPEATEFLASKKIRLLGMDTPSPSMDWKPIHEILLRPDREIVLVENLTNLDELPEEFVFAAFPLKIQDADGCPARAVGII